MNRDYRAIAFPFAPASPVGRLAAFISRMARAFAIPSRVPGPGSSANPPLLEGGKFLRVSAGPESPNSPSSSCPRILVADDNPSNQADACELLGCLGVTPMLAGDGAEAVALACGHDFDLILMDLQMPVVNGLAATKQIRAHEQEHSRARVPVLAYSSQVPAGDLLRACGIDGVLEKPTNAKTIQECLIRWCTPKSGSNLETNASSASRVEFMRGDEDGRARRHQA